MGHNKLDSIGFLGFNKAQNDYNSPFSLGIIGSGPAGIAFQAGFYSKYDTKRVSTIYSLAAAESAAWNKSASNKVLNHQDKNYFPEFIEKFYKSINYDSLVEKQNTGNQRNKIGKSIDDFYQSFKSCIDDSTNIFHKQKNAQIYKISFDKESSKVEVEYKDNTGQMHQTKFDQVVVATGMSPPEIKREGLPKNFINSPLSSPNYIDDLKQRITNEVIRRKKSGIKDKLIITTIGMGGATELDWASSFGTLDDDIKDSCEFLRIGNSKKSRPASLYLKEENFSDELKEQLDKFSNCDDLDAIIAKVAEIKNEFLSDKVKEGHLRPLLLKSVEKRLKTINNDESFSYLLTKENQDKYRSFYLTQLATDQEQAVNNSNSLFHVKKVDGKVDFSELDNSPTSNYVNKQKDIAFKEAENGKISFKLQSGEELESDFIINCTGPWKAMRRNMENMGITQDLLDSGKVEVIGAAAAFLPKYGLTQHGQTKFPLCVPAQFGPTVESSYERGEKLAEKISNNPNAKKECHLSGSRGWVANLFNNLSNITHEVAAR